MVNKALDDVLTAVEREIALLGNEFVREVRNFWRDKEAVFYHGETQTKRPYMSGFGSLKAFQKVYANAVLNYIRRKAEKGEGTRMKERLCYLAAHFGSAAPDDKTLFPVVEEVIGRDEVVQIGDKIVRPMIVLPNGEKIPLLAYQH